MRKLCLCGDCDYAWFQLKGKNIPELTDVRSFLSLLLHPSLMVPERVKIWKDSLEELLLLGLQRAMLHKLELHWRPPLPRLSLSSFNSFFTELTDESRWSSLQVVAYEELRSQETQICQGRDPSRHLWNSIRQDSRALSIHILRCSKGAGSSAIFLLAQGRSSKRIPQLLHSSTMSLLPVPLLVLMILFALSE